MEIKVGQTGTVFRLGRPFELGEFVVCRVFEIHGEKILLEKILLELQDGSRGEIQKTEFSPRYMVMPSIEWEAGRR